MNMTDLSMKNNKLFSLMFIAIVFLAGCSFGSGREVKSKLEYLDGRNWEKSQFTIGNAQLPTKMKTIDTVIKGAVYKNGLAPLKFTSIYLIKDNKIIATTLTNHLGIFKLQGIIPNGNYILKVDSKPNSWEKEINIDKYELNGLELNIN
jgi:hypothetical protein